MTRVRFAPSPTGILHVGGIRTALFNYFYAKATKGVFILRIEDTDQARLVPGAVDQIKDSLNWLGISWDEFVTQSERLETYKKYANELVEKGMAKVEEGAVRFITPSDGKTLWVDAVGNKEVSFENKDIEDFIILKKDGFPTYHLANVVDDHLMQITHVIRGEDWIPSCPKHIMLYSAFGWETPVFAHVPNVLGIDGKKLSKRRGAKGVMDFKTEGIVSEALLNYLMLLGWSPKNDKEILSISEIEKEFKLENINSAPAVFDERKLLWMNGEYIRQLAMDTLRSTLLELDPSLKFLDNLDQYLLLAQTRMKTLIDFKHLAVNIQAINLNEKQKVLRDSLLEAYKKNQAWTEDLITQITFDTRDNTSTSTKDLYIVLTGKAQGLPLIQKLIIDGKDKTIEFLNSQT